MSIVLLGIKSCHKGRYKTVAKTKQLTSSPAFAAAICTKPARLALSFLPC